MVSGTGTGNEGKESAAKGKAANGKIGKTGKNGKISKPGRTGKKKKPLTPQEKAKLRVARELGLYEQIRASGWGSLSAKECGQIGGILSKKTRERESRKRA